MTSRASACAYRKARVPVLGGSKPPVSNVDRLKIPGNCAEFGLRILTHAWEGPVVIKLITDAGIDAALAIRGHVLASIEHYTSAEVNELFVDLGVRRLFGEGWVGFSSMQLLGTDLIQYGNDHAYK